MEQKTIYVLLFIVLVGVVAVNALLLFCMKQRMRQRKTVTKHFSMETDVISGITKVVKHDLAKQRSGYRAIAARQSIGTDEVVEGLLDAYRLKCSGRGIAWRTEVASIDIEMLATDIIGLLSNLLDNAIEAVERSERKGYISCCIKRKSMIIENSKSENEYPEVNEFKTNKQDANSHGIGMSIIRSIVSKYDGSLKYTDVGDRMIVEIIFAVREDKYDR